MHSDLEDEKEPVTENAQGRAFLAEGMPSAKPRVETGLAHSENRKYFRSLGLKLPEQGGDEATV